MVTKSLQPGGLTGTIVKVTDDVETVDVEIAKDVKVHVVRAMIADVKRQKRASQSRAC